MPPIVCVLARKARAVLAASFLGAFASPPCAVAAEEDRHGAIAFSQGSGGDHAWGIAWSFEGRTGAVARAIEECGREGGGDCVQVGWFRNACGALAVGGGNGYGAGWGESTQAAEADALSECGFRNDGCRVVISRCAEAAEEEDASQTAWSPGQTFRDCPSCPELVVIPSGSFRMGCLSDDGDCDDIDEFPVHVVTIGRPFALGVHEVTFSEWDACVAGGGCGGHRPEDQGWGRGARPVIGVSWDDARAYVSWLSLRTGHGYRLPSESEWEYAARSGTETAYWWGDRIGVGRANCSSGCGDQWDWTAPVGSFAASPWGLHDMHGNVWEWVQDCWNGNYEGAPSDGRAWETGNCTVRVLRGGSWLNPPWDLRAAARGRGLTGSRVGYAGFRVARTLN